MLKKSKAFINHHQKNAKILIRSWRREALVKKFHSGDHYHHLYAKKNQIKAILTSTTRTTTTALKKPKKAQKFNIYSMTTTKNQEKSHLGQRLRLIWQKNFILGTIILTPMQKKSKKYTINFYNKDNNNGKKKKKEKLKNHVQSFDHRNH